MAISANPCYEDAVKGLKHWYPVTNTVNRANRVILWFDFNERGKVRMIQQNLYSDK